MIDRLKKNDGLPIAEKFGKLKKDIDGNILDFVKQASFDPVLRDMIEIANNILLSKNAKRIRAIIPLLLAEETNVNIEDAKRYGVLVELLHFTSLVHDDVVDETDQRRKQPTLNSRFTNTNAVRIGDHFICQSTEYALRTKNSSEVIAVCMSAVKDLIAGIILEHQLAEENLGYPAYEKMVILKTGSLFGLSFGLPFINTDKLDAGLEAGRRFGLLFQIYDDYFDRATDYGFINIYNIFSEDQIRRRCSEIYQEIRNKCDRLEISDALNQTMKYLRTFDYFSDLQLH